MLHTSTTSACEGSSGEQHDGSLDVSSETKPVTTRDDDDNNNGNNDDNNDDGNNNNNSSRNNNNESLVPNVRERKFVCPHTECGKGYYTSSHLKRHMKVHETDGKPESCVICSARFAKRSQLRIHVSSTHKKDPMLANDERTREQIEAILHCEPYTCPYDGCGRTFSTEGRLNKHVKRHQEERHVCGYANCDARFGFRKELLQHIRTVHRSPMEGSSGGSGGNSGIVCGICGTKFKNSDNLRQHIKRFHSGQMQIHRCPYEGCVNSYNNLSNLNVHIRACHTKEFADKWKCCKCNQFYAHRHTLRKHLANVHKMGKGKIEEELKRIDREYNARKTNVCAGEASTSQNSSTVDEAVSLKRKREESDDDSCSSGSDSSEVDHGNSDSCQPDQAPSQKKKRRKPYNTLLSTLLGDYPIYT